MNDETRAVLLAAEVTALTVARQGKPMCLTCGLYATTVLTVTSIEGDYYTRPEDPDGGRYLDPHFCCSCQPVLKPHWKMVPVEGAPVARRLNRLLRELG